MGKMDAFLSNIFPWMQQHHPPPPPPPPQQQPQRLASKHQHHHTDSLHSTVLTTTTTTPTTQSSVPPTPRGGRGGGILESFSKATATAAAVAPPPPPPPREEDRAPIPMDIVGVAVAAPPVATAAATVAAASNHTSHGHSEVAKVKNEPNAPHHHPLPEDDRNNTNSNNVNPRSLAAVRKRKFLRRTAAQSSSLKRIQNHPHTAIAATAVNVIPVEEPSSDEQEHHRPEKLFRGATRTIRLYTNATTAEEEKVDTTTIPIVAPPPLVLPEDLVQHTLSFLGTVSDRFALQTTCRQFHRLSNAMPDLLRDIPVGGGSGGNSSLQQQQHEIATGTDSTTNNEAKCTTAGRSHEDDRHRRRVILRSILLETDTPATASAKLEPFCAAGNLEAIYMLGIIKSYCECNVENGIDLLEHASNQGYVRASYALGLVLRDANPPQAIYYMNLAAQKKYLPALQEVLPARDMKALYGEPNAEELRRHMDFDCLNRLLSRHYIQSTALRTVNTSHCWNHLCGRWAFKATAHNTSSTTSPGINSNTSLVSPTGSIINGGVGIVSPSGSSTGSHATFWPMSDVSPSNRVSRMKMCSRCCRAKYCSKLCQVYDWRSGRHKMECQFL